MGETGGVDRTGGEQFGASPGAHRCCLPAGWLAGEHGRSAQGAPAKITNFRRWSRASGSSLVGSDKVNVRLLL